MQLIGYFYLNHFGIHRNNFRFRSSAPGFFQGLTRLFMTVYSIGAWLKFFLLDLILDADLLLPCHIRVMPSICLHIQLWKLPRLQIQRVRSLSFTFIFISFCLKYFVLDKGWLNLRYSRVLPGYLNHSASSSRWPSIMILIHLHHSSFSNI